MMNGYEKEQNDNRENARKNSVAVNRDTELWFDCHKQIYRGEMRLEDLPCAEGKKNVTRCYINCTTWNHPNLNIRTLVLLYDQIFMAFPFRENLDSFCEEQQIGWKDIVELVGRGRLVIVCTSDESRYDMELIDTLYRVNSAGVVTRRGVNAIYATYFRVLHNSSINMWSMYDDSMATFEGLQGSDIGQKISDIILWPYRALENSFECLSFYQPYKVASIGPNNLFMRDHENSVDVINAKFELTVNTDTILLASALQATYFPFEQVSNKTGDVYSDAKATEVLGILLNHYRYPLSYDNEQSKRFADGLQRARAKINLVKPEDNLSIRHSVGNTCYLSCYIAENFHAKEGYNEIGIQSSNLDDVFRYKYNYIDYSRNGNNYAVDIIEIYSLPFNVGQSTYNLSYCIGHNGKIGLLEDFERNGEVRIKLNEGTVLECNELICVLHRFSMFMNSQVDVSFKKITLYNDGIVAGWFYSDNVHEDNISVKEVLFFEFDVMKYVPKIINNIAQDCGSIITKSVPLGHLSNRETEYSPQRFIEQVMAFEYLFEKIETEKAKNTKWTLKKELELMFGLFPYILEKTTLDANMVSKKVKDTRIDIVHGYAYYYDFESDNELQYIIILLDKLIKAMSLKWMGFSNEEIKEYPHL